MNDFATTLTQGNTALRDDAYDDAVAIDAAPINTFDVKGLDLFYGKTQALKDISMTIRKNEITALIGPSGCGKSTFLKTLNRMNDLIESCHITGQVLFEGKDIFRDVDPLALRYRVGMSRAVLRSGSSRLAASMRDALMQAMPAMRNMIAAKGSSDRK